MRLIHLSDLHFGTEQLRVIPHLTTAIKALAPHLIIISGDFTQTGSAAEFEKAAHFINTLPAPAFCVPGNHDIPRFNPLARFFNPYGPYRRYIAPTLEPQWQQDGILITGLNSARRILPHWNWAHGAISRQQIRTIRERVHTPHADFKICVIHHPLHRAEESPLKVTVFGVHDAMRAIRDSQIDLVLTGHVHHASVTALDNTIFASAATAISGRLRKQKNGFNVIDIEPDKFHISLLSYEDTPPDNKNGGEKPGFTVTQSHSFPRRPQK